MCTFIKREREKKNTHQVSYTFRTLFLYCFLCVCELLHLSFCLLFFLLHVSGLVVVVVVVVSVCCLCVCCLCGCLSNGAKAEIIILPGFCSELIGELRGLFAAAEDPQVCTLWGCTSSFRSCRTCTLSRRCSHSQSLGQLRRVCCPRSSLQRKS